MANIVLSFRIILVQTLPQLMVPIKEILVKEVDRLVIFEYGIFRDSCTLYGTKHNIITVINLKMKLLMT